MDNLGVLEKVRAALTSSAYDALLVSGTDNGQYLIGASLPFQAYRHGQPLAVFWPKGGEPVCLCPAEWVSTIQATGRVADVRGYAETADNFAVLASLVGELALKTLDPAARVGFDAADASSRLFDLLTETLGDRPMVDCSAWFADLRMVKTPAEIDLLEKIAYRTDHGINGAIHHVVVERFKTQLTLAEEIRVHCEERLLDLRGYRAAAQAAGGKHARKFWPDAPNYGFSALDALGEGDAIRMSMRAWKDGYWSDASRMMTMGQPSDDQWEAYGQLVDVRELLLARLRPGVRCADVYLSVAQAASNAGLALLPGFGLGHGLGVAPSEPPYLAAWDTTELAAGMVLVLDPLVRGRDEVLWRSKDTVVITADGCQLVGWYRDWREPYIPIQCI